MRQSWRRSASRLPTASQHSKTFAPDKSCFHRNTAKRDDSQTRISYTCGAAAPLSSTAVLRQKHDRGTRGTPLDVNRTLSHSTSAPQATSSPSDAAAAASISTVASAVSASVPPTRTKNDRTGELLRCIARRGGRAIRHARLDVTAALFQTSPSTEKNKKAKAVDRSLKEWGGNSRVVKKDADVSPLARLFAAPSPLSAALTKGKAGQRNTAAGQQKRQQVSSDALPSSHENSNNTQTKRASAPISPPSRALLTKLLYIIQHTKRIPWDSITRAHPEILQMPLYACRDEWMAEIGAHGSASPLSTSATSSCDSLSSSSATATPPLFLCAAATGTGKSVLLPLFALDAHWAALEQRLRCTLEVYDDTLAQLNKSEFTDSESDGGKPLEAGDSTSKSVSAVQPFPLSSQVAFIREFTACSQLCIVVSQPTRISCAELAKYVCTLLHAQRQFVDATTTDSSTLQTDRGNVGQSTQNDVCRQLMGKRVGYAVGGEPRFCAATELIYATPGYVLSALQLSPQTVNSTPSPIAPTAASVSLTPTTLMVDEAHCRDIETDALLAWMKLSREYLTAPTNDVAVKRRLLRQYYVVSATMQLTAVDEYLSRPLPSHGNGDDSEGEAQGEKTKEKSTRYSTKAEPRKSAAQPPPPLLLLSPAQRQRVDQWWLSSRGQSLDRNAPPLRQSQEDVKHTMNSAEGCMALIQSDRCIRRAVLQLIEGTEGEVYYPGDGVAKYHTHELPPLALTVSQGNLRSTAEVSTSSCRSVEPPSFSHIEDDDLPQGIVVSTAPYRVERFFVDDLDPQNGCFEHSRVLFDEGSRRAAAAEHGKNTNTGDGGYGRASSATNNKGDNGGRCVVANHYAFSNLPLCLSAEGSNLRRHLIQVFGTRSSSYNLFTSQTRLLTSFVLEMLQAARHRWVASTTASAATEVFVSSFRASEGSPTDENTITAAPVTILLFMAGISEIYQLVQSLERVCEKVQQPNYQQQRQRTGYLGSGSVADSSATTVEVFRSGQEVFSVGLLHASAVGSPQAQLDATAHTGAPLRLLLSTNVAESSITIPNTRIVIDTCLERRVQADVLTGTTRVMTAFVSPSGLRQRCGRVGRTADGVVIHLAPRHYVLPPAARNHEAVDMQQRRRAVNERCVAKRRDGEEDENKVNTYHAASASSELEPLADGVVTALLHMKYLFADVAAALAAMPLPPTAAEVRMALQQLVDMELLVLPTEVRLVQTAGSEKENEKETDVFCDAATPSSPFRRVNECFANNLMKETDKIPAATTSSLDYLLNHSTFTAKGRLVASLPLPYEHAAFIYHAFQFLCVEDAILLACAMAVPTLFTTPRITAHSLLCTSSRKATDSDFTWSHPTTDAKPALSPLESFYKRLWVQRSLAGFPCPSGPANQQPHQNENGHAGNRSGDSTGHLSEPLMLRAVMRRWYAQPSLGDSGKLLNDLKINRAALRQVDNMVEQCCTRLIHLLVKQGTGVATESACDAKLSADSNTELEGEEHLDESSAEGTEKDFGAYVCAAAPATLEKRDSNDDNHNLDLTRFLSFVEEWPAGVLDQLLRSLRRLQRAAYSRVHLRRSHSQFRAGLTQWYDSEERWVQLCSQPYVRSAAPARRSTQYPREQQHLKMMTFKGKLNAYQRSEEHVSNGEETQQQRAVRQHPSFIYWGHQHAQQQQGAHRQHTPVPGSVTTTTTEPYPALPTVPPPLNKRLTRARSPVYRPPPPPPPIPPVAFVLGHCEDRLCAAFIAAFGHRTMRGEDGGHRFHHRRLVRNLQTLEQDADHVCTFHISLQQAHSKLVSSQKRASSGVNDSLGEAANEFQTSRLNKDSNYGSTFTTSAPPPVVSSRTSSVPYEYLAAAGVTPHVIRAALAPYMAGAGLQQLEVFQSNRLAVAARFATSGFAALWSSIEKKKEDCSVEKTAEIGKGDDGENATGAEDETEIYDDVKALREGGDATVGSQSSSFVADKSSIAACGPEPAPQALDTDVLASKGDPRKVSSCSAAASGSDLLKPVPLSLIRGATQLTEQQQQQSNNSRVQTVSRRETNAAGNPYVQLAPFGVSLLISAVSGSGAGGLGGLQNIPLSVEVPLQDSSCTCSSTGCSAATAAATTAGYTADRHVSSVSLATDKFSTTFSSTPSCAVGVRHVSNVEAHRNLRFSAGPSAADVKVSWADSFGTYSRALQKAEVDALGLSDLFPTPAPQPPAPPNSSRPIPSRAVAADAAAQSVGRAEEGNEGEPSTQVSKSTELHENCQETQSSPSTSASIATPAHSFMLTINPPVHITRGITWKVPLPTTVSLPRRGVTISKSSLHYCVLCQHLCGSRHSFQQHCRGSPHLDHLYHAVQLGLNRTQLEQLYGYPPQRQQEEAPNTESEEAATQSSSRNKCSEGERQRTLIWSTARTTPTLAPSVPSLSTSPSAVMPLLSLLSLDPIQEHRGFDNAHHSSALTSPHLAPGALPPRLAAQQLHPCVINALSFLNCLQWTTRSTAPAVAIGAASSSKASESSTTTGVEQSKAAEVDCAAATATAASMNVGALRRSAEISEAESDGGDRATPLAVAGSLVEMQTTADILPPPHLRVRPLLSTTSLSSSSAFDISGVTNEVSEHLNEVDSGSSSGGNGASQSATAPFPSSVTASTLSAHHVWVLNVSTPPCTSQYSHQTPPPMSLLFVLAGYLAAASPQAMVALLFNAAHTHLHGVMLYGLGAWKLPQPLPIIAYAGIFEHIGKGGGWPGLLVPMRDRGHFGNPQQQQGVYEGLHWCAPTGQCRMCAASEISSLNKTLYSGKGGYSAPITKSNLVKATDEMKVHWPMVEATLLLTLQEYLQARRNMVMLVDYVERVLRKLQLSPFIAAAAPATDVENDINSKAFASSTLSRSTTPRVTAARLLAHFVTHARGGQGIQSLLRDVGCVFNTPPHALSALLETAHTETPFDAQEDHGRTHGKIHSRSLSVSPRGPKNRTGVSETTSPRTATSSTDCSDRPASAPSPSAWSKRLSQRALGAEGAVLELMFTLPPVLPSVLPPVDYAQRLRAFYEARHAERWSQPKALRVKIQKDASARPSAPFTFGGADAPKGTSHHRGNGGKWDDQLMF